MKTTTLLLAAGLFLIPAAAASAQAAQPVRYMDDTMLELRRYEPRYVDAASLYQTLQQIYGRDLVFEDRQVDNLAILDASLVIYEEPGRLAKILKAIQELDTSMEEQAESEDEGVLVLSSSEVDLESYMPRYMQAAELFSLASELYGRQFMVEDNWQDNLRLSQRAILVYEERAAAEAMLRKLASLDESQAPQPGAALEVHEYQPRHFSPDGLMQGLQPFRAMVNDHQNGSYSQATNITLMPERGTILVRDYSERAAQILSALERLDQPAPQVMVVCQVLRGLDHAADRPADEALQAQLRQLLPHKSYAVEATGMLRGSAVAGNGMELEMESFSMAGTQFQLKMLVGSFDAKSGALGLQTCQFSTTGPQTGRRNLFGTSTTVYRGEQAVLGVAGAEPLFLVVQIHPVDGPAGGVH